MFGVGLLSCVLFTGSLSIRQELILSVSAHPSYITTTLKQTSFDQGVKQKPEISKLEILLQIRLLSSPTGLFKEDCEGNVWDFCATVKTERKSASVSQMKSVKAQLIAAVTLSDWIRMPRHDQYQCFNAMCSMTMSLLSYQKAATMDKVLRYNTPCQN